MAKAKKIAVKPKSKTPVAKKAAPKPAAKKTVVKKKTVAVAKRPAAAKAPRAPKRPSGLPEILRDEALKILNDRQGEDIVTIDLTGRSSVADYLIVVSARSARQISAIAHYLREAFMKHGIKHVRSEGLREGNWAILDGGDIIVHIFRPEVRTYYNLESLWDGKAERRERAEQGA